MSYLSLRDLGYGGDTGPPELLSEKEASRLEAAQQKADVASGSSPEARDASMAAALQSARRSTAYQSATAAPEPGFLDKLGSGASSLLSVVGGILGIGGAGAGAAGSGEAPSLYHPSERQTYAISPPRTSLTNVVLAGGAVALAAGAAVALARSARSSNPPRRRRAWARGGGA